MMNNDGITNTSTDHQNTFQLGQIIIGLLLGSGGASTAIAIGGKEGLQLYGLGALIFCIISAIFIFVTINRTEERIRKENLDYLNEKYIDGFKTIGDLMARSLHEEEERSKIFKVLVNDLNTQKEYLNGESKIIFLYKEGLNSIAEKWSELAKGVPKEAPPKQ